MLQPIHQHCLQKLAVDSSARAIYHGDPSISTPSLISQLIVNVDKGKRAVLHTSTERVWHGWSELWMG